MPTQVRILPPPSSFEAPTENAGQEASGRRPAGDPPEEALARPPAVGARPDRGRRPGDRRDRRRLLAVEAPRRRPQRLGSLQARKAEAAEGADCQLADVRAQPGPDPLPAGEGGQAAVSPALALHGTTAARVPAGLRPRQAVRRQQRRHRLRARREHRQGPLGTPRRTAQRLRSHLLQRSSVHRQSRPRACRQARCQDRQDHLETAAARARRVLAAGSRQDPLLRLRRRGAVRAQHPQRQRALVDLPRAGP